MDLPKKVSPNTRGSETPWLWLVLASVGCCAAGKVSAAQAVVASVVKVSGKVEVASGLPPKWKAASIQAPLRIGDFVRTGPSGKATIRFADGSETKVLGGSRLQIDPSTRAQDEHWIIRLLHAVSEIFVRDKGNTEVRSAAGVAAARGTGFLVQILSDGTMVVTVADGSVDFSNDYGRQLVNAGQQSLARIGEAPTPPVAVDVSGLMAWTADLRGVPVEFDAGQLAGADQRLATAVVEVKAGRLAQARQALQGAPAGALTDTVRGLVELYSGNADQAVTALQSALGQDDQLAQAHALLGLSRLLQNQLAPAETSARRAVELQPDSAQTQASLAMVLFFAKRPDEAGQAAKRAVALNPESSFALLTQGRVLLAQLQADAAVDALTQARDLAPGLDAVHADLGAAWLRLDMPVRAEMAYREALRLSPGSAAARAGLSRALQHQGMDERSLAEAMEALEMAPGDAGARGHLAALHIEQGRFDDAKRELEKGVKSAPDRGILYVRLAEIALYKQQLLDAQECALKSVGLLPKSAVAHYQLGRVYLEQQRTVQAEQQFRQATALDPNFAKARFALGIAREQAELGSVFSDPLGAVAAANEGGPAQGLNIQQLQTPGVEDRIQAAIQDPTVVRTASRAFGDTQLDGLIGQDGVNEFSLSHLQSTADARGMWSLTAERTEEDGVRANADSKVERVGLSLGTKKADRPDAFFALAQYEHDNAGTDFGPASTALAATQRVVTNKRYAVVGYSAAGKDGSLTRALVHADQPSQNNTDMNGFTNTDMHSVHSEVRHDFAPKGDHRISAGASWGYRDFEADTLLRGVFPLPDIRTVNGVTIHSAQAYVRDSLPLGKDLDLMGELKVNRLEALTRQTVIAPLGFPAAAPATQKTTVGLPNLILTYQPTARSTLRLRARAITGPIADFELLAPTDVFLFPMNDLPNIQRLGRARSFELEYDHTFGDGSFLRLGAFHRRLRQGTSVSGETLTEAEIQSVRARYEGTVSPSTTFFVAANLNDAEAIVDAGVGFGRSTNQELTNAPSLTAEVGVQYLDAEGWFAQPSFAYVGSRQQSVAFPGFPARQELGGFGVWNLRVGRRSGVQSSVFVEIANLFGKRYTVGAGVAEQLQHGRQVRFGLTQRF